MYILYCGSNNVLILGVQIVTILSYVVLSQLYVLVVGLLQGIESLLLPTLLGMNSNIIKKGDQGTVFNICQISYCWCHFVSK